MAACPNDMLLSLLAACALADAPASSPAPTVEPVEEAEPTYAERISALDETRRALAARLDAGEPTDTVLDEARSALHAGIRDLIGPWTGTPWDFYGTSQTPGQGEIACGYFVSTVLRDAGLEVERVKLAQQASEHILLSLTSEASVRRWRNHPVDDIVRIVEAAGEGTAIVGLDFHVGFLVHDGDEVRFCHSSWVGRAGVMCEDPRASEALPSRYTVVGWLGEEALVEGWLRGTPITTRTR